VKERKRGILLKQRKAIPTNPRRERRHAGKRRGHIEFHGAEGGKKRKRTNF